MHKSWTQKQAIDADYDGNDGFAIEVICGGE